MQFRPAPSRPSHVVIKDFPHSGHLANRRTPIELITTADAAIIFGRLSQLRCLETTNFIKLTPQNKSSAIANSFCKRRQTLALSKFDASISSFLNPLLPYIVPYFRFSGPVLVPCRYLLDSQNTNRRHKKTSLHVPLEAVGKCLVRNTKRGERVMRFPLQDAVTQNVEKST